MMPRLVPRTRYAAFLAIAFEAQSSRAAEVEYRTPTPFDDLGENVVASFTGVPLLLHTGAAASTGMFVWGGADHVVRVYVQHHLVAPLYGDTAYYVGYGLPLLGPPLFYVTSLFSADTQLIGASASVLQAVALTVSTTLVLKIATGRPFPLHGGDPQAPDRLKHPEYAREFRPFHLDGHIAWPSGHTSSMTSIAASLSAYFVDVWPVLAISYPIALATGFGMIVADRHWASDVVAGALTGHAIGWSVGTGFRESLRAGKPKTAARLRLVPMAGSVTGFAATGEW